MKNRIFLRSLAALIGSGILGFGLYHVHSFSGVTEGGQLGLILLLQHWLHISPAFSSAVLNVLCYVLGWKILGKSFLYYSAISAFGFSLTYRICESFPPLWPQLVSYPWLAALLGALFVGVGCGLCVRVGGAPSGDDALAMGLSKQFGVKIERIYLISDLSILLLSLTYIPATRIAYSLLTVILSGKLVGIIQRIPFPSSMQKRSPYESQEL
jgi:uncharacterized membrane-anchored protein YitT (DUF2179 family)